MDEPQYVGGRLGQQTHETDRHSVDLLALIYRALLDDLPPRPTQIGSEQGASRTSQSQPLVQEARP
jgi:hypothetical protein